ncbi:16S rRNA (guanine(966)-N(2))-methyltransferase RsmD [Thiogranum longum]|nr:16S rRNA (guanine(966)-N(2))-methyltransferase RsmD [Thiogranum longum]
MASSANQVRIIAGRWRGRKLTFPDAEGLRPSSDRVRETLFNWLSGLAPGACCLDMFAGSGALGFEAASRGADCVVLLERNPAVAEALQASRDQLDGVNIEVHCTDALRWVQSCNASFDLVFLDPPFSDSRLLANSVAALVAGHCVKPGARIYLELPKQTQLPALPEDWIQEKAKVAGDVGYYLYRRKHDARD